MRSLIAILAFAAASGCGVQPSAESGAPTTSTTTEPSPLGSTYFDVATLPTIGVTREIVGEGFTFTVLEFTRWQASSEGAFSSCPDVDRNDELIAVKIRLELVSGVSDTVPTGVWVLTDAANSDAAVHLRSALCDVAADEWPIPTVNASRSYVGPAAPVVEGWMLFPLAQAAVEGSELLLGVKTDGQPIKLFLLGRLD